MYMQANRVRNMSAGTVGRLSEVGVEVEGRWVDGGGRRDNWVEK